MLSAKENYLTILRGGVPEYVPHHDKVVQQFTPQAFGDPYSMLYGMYFEALEKGEPVDDIRGTDVFGVQWLLDDKGPITDVKNILFTEMDQWREKYTIPDLEGYDWDSDIAATKEMMDADKVQALIVVAPFMQLVNAMDFANALIALAAEPKEAHAFLDASTQHLETCITETLKRLDYDHFQVFDDVASAAALFMSPEMYRQFIKPYDARLIAAARSVRPEITAEMHCCGHCQAIIDDFVEIGCGVWQPAQPMNDLAGIKARYGNSLVICGGWDNVVATTTQEVSEAEVRASVRATIDALAPGGGYIFWEGGPVGSDPRIVERLGWANDEAVAYGQTFYQKEA
jgi:hypothetical protein